MMDDMSTTCMVPVFPLVILLLQASQLRPPQRDKINQDAYLRDFHLLKESGLTHTRFAEQADLKPHNTCHAIIIV